MNILNEIIENKKREVAERKSLYPYKLLEKSPFFDTQSVSLKEYILRDDLNGIIAEYKRKSPSKGIINDYADIKDISVGYMQAGASAISVLTDKKYFGGNFDDLTTARNFNYCPILQKDFFIDEYQIVEAKSIGADAILLIASVLTRTKIENLIKLAHSLQLEVLLEIHNEEELKKFDEGVDVLGVNNRNLSSFNTSIENSINLYASLPTDVIKISESGIKSAQDLVELKKIGFNGFLIGENFMKSTNPVLACKAFINEINKSNLSKNSNYEVESLRIK